jgi:hypothetical protein
MLFNINSNKEEFFSLTVSAAAKKLLFYVGKGKKFQFKPVFRIPKAIYGNK